MMARVYHAEWRLRDAGRSFAVGDSVAWLVAREADQDWLGVPDIEPIEWSESAVVVDDRSLYRLTGTVESIEALLCRFEHPRGGDPVPGSETLTDVDKAGGPVAFQGDLTQPAVIGYIASVSLDGPLVISRAEEME